MMKLVFETPNRKGAKEVANFWNSYTSLDSYLGNASGGYVIEYNDEYKITSYRAYSYNDIEGLRIHATRTFKEIPPFMKYPKEIQEAMVEHSTSKSPIPFILDRWAADTYGGFDWSKSKEGRGFWSEIVDNENFDYFYTYLKTKEDESRLCNKETPFGGGSIHNASGVCGRKHQARVTVQSLSYQKISGRG